MLSNERVGFESAYAARASRTSDKEPFTDDKILVSSWRVFFCIHAWFLFFVSSENQKKEIRLFCVYTDPKYGTD
jgi:hypothetical protein